MTEVRACENVVRLCRRILGRRPFLTVAWGNAPGICYADISFGRRPYSPAWPRIPINARAQHRPLGLATDSTLRHSEATPESAISAPETPAAKPHRAKQSPAPTQSPVE